MAIFWPSTLARLAARAPRSYTHLMKPELLDPPAAPAAAPARAADEPIFGRPNIMWGWVGIVLGPTVGSILMAWCFAGPFPSPMERLADYDGVERRMLRLAHVA